jgi:hypothetical protein
MAKSLERYGQLSPVVVCRRGERYELIDGFKRLAAARRLAQIDVLSARLMEADERTVKAAIYGLNRAGGRTREPRRRHEPGGSGGAFGAAQELGMPTTGAPRTPRIESARWSAPPGSEAAIRLSIYIPAVARILHPSGLLFPVPLLRDAKGRAALNSAHPTPIKTSNP